MAVMEALMFHKHSLLPYVNTLYFQDHVAS